MIPDEDGIKSEREVSIRIYIRYTHITRLRDLTGYIFRPYPEVSIIGWWSPAIDSANSLGVLPLREL